MATTTEPLGTIWVCIDCLMVGANGADYDTTNADSEPWSKIADSSLVTMGMMEDEHDDDCPAFENGETTGNECHGCETQTFSWSPCEGCGSHLGGSRHAYTLWEKRN